jgi:transcriptional regulator with XRE-family HTH domain
MTKLRNLRVAAGLTQRELSERSGVNLRMVQHFEQGQKPIDKAHIGTPLRLAVALGCSISDIVETEGLVDMASEYDAQICLKNREN